MFSKVVTVAGVSMLVFGASAMAQEKEAAAAKPEIKFAGDLELFYETGSDTGGADDNDQFKTQQLYFTTKGKFDGGMEAMLKLDAADIVSGDGKFVTEKIVEEANFTLKDVAGSPVTLAFGKDEMPFGMDYDKYLTDPIVHNFEIDKVWGLNAALDLGKIGVVETGVYEHRNGSPANEATGNWCARYGLKDIAGRLSFEVSGGVEMYDLADDAEADAAPLKDESRLSAGMKCDIGKGNVNLEYTAFQGIKGVDGNDPALVTAGIEQKLNESLTGYFRYEKILSDGEGREDGEEDFYMAGLGYEPVKNYVLSIEYCNFTTGNLNDTSDLYVAKGKLEDTLKIGVHAMF